MGQRDNKQTMDSKYLFNPYNKVEITKNFLPHWQQGDVFIFVSWRLGDSLPQELIKSWKRQKQLWFSANPKPWDEKTDQEYHKTFTNCFDSWLDECSGSCILKDKQCSQIVANVLEYENEKKYHHFIRHHA